MDNQSRLSETLYSCDDCCKSYSGKRSLHLHITRVHNKKKLKSCDVCAKCFFDSSDLNKHKMTHTGEQPFSCNYCDRSFSMKRNMKKHKRTMHNICETCGEAFQNQDDLKEHTKIEHGPNKLFNCDICPKTFFVNAHFKNHKIKHNGGKPFACDLCYEMFSSKRTLLRHEILKHRKYEKVDSIKSELLTTKKYKPLKGKTLFIQIFFNISSFLCPVNFFSIMK